MHFFLVFHSFFRKTSHLFSRNHYRSLFRILFFTEVISITLNLILLIHWRILWTSSSSQYHRCLRLQDPPPSALFNLNKIKIRAKDLQSCSCQAWWIQQSPGFACINLIEGKAKTTKLPRRGISVLRRQLEIRKTPKPRTWKYRLDTVNNLIDSKLL